MARQGKKSKKEVKMDKELKKQIQEVLKPLGKISFKPNRSYVAIWLKRKKSSDLILCFFQGKKKYRLCLPWSTLSLPLDNDKLPLIVEEFLLFKQSESISKNIKKLEKALREKSLIS